MTPFLISPPFGSFRFFDYRNATCVLGSYTLNRRRGRWWRVAQFFWENWRDPVPGGWVNHIGLRNGGIGSVEFNNYHLHLYSLVGLEDDDWEEMLAYLHHHADTHVRFELNLGCPNVHEYSIRRAALTQFCDTYWCGVKLPADPEKALAIAEMAVQCGARYLHAGNTLPTPRGGFSGEPLKPVNLKIVEMLAKRFPGINVIGGGGIYHFPDLVDYRNAGATVYSLATVCFRPWLAKRIIRLYESTYGTECVAPPLRTLETRLGETNLVPRNERSERRVHPQDRLSQ